MVDLHNFISQYYPLACLLLALLFFAYHLWVLVIKPNNTILKTSSNILRPPEVAGAWPIVGHLPRLVGSTPLFKVLGNMCDKYGPIFIVRFGMYPTLVVSSWEMSRECFTTNDKLLTSRPPSAAGKYLTYKYAMFGFSSYGPYWREVRKISTVHLLSHKRLELLKHVRYSEIDNCMRSLYQRWMKSQNQIQHNCLKAGSSHKVDMTQVFGDLTLNVVLKLVVGQPLFMKKDINEHFTEDDLNKEEEEGRKLHKTIIELFKLSGVSVASDALPFLGWLDVDGQIKQMKKIAKEMDLITENWLEEHRQKRRLQTPTSAATVPRIYHDGNDFMDVLLSVLGEERDDLFFGYDRDTVVKATCLTLISAGSDTTSVSLTWALSLLLTNPSILRKAQDELDTVVGKDRNVDERDINDLVYLQAIIKETLRLYPAAPLSLPHEAIEDCIVGGCEVKAGTRLLLNLWKLHRDPQVWSNPSDFKPERFLQQVDGAGGEAAHLDFRGHHFQFTPFGSGRRICPGMNFAIDTLHIVLARLLHAFNFDNESTGLVIDMTEGSGITMPKVTPLEVHLRPRLPATLY